MEKAVDNSQKQSADIPTNLQEVSRVILVGAFAGLLVALLSEVIARFFIEPVFCRSSDTLGVCTGGDTIAFNTALVVINMIAVAVLVKMNVYRPLLVSLGAVASLWSINTFIGQLSVLEYGFWMVGLSALAYVLFFWLMRARNFIVALITLIITVIAIRVLLAV